MITTKIQDINVFLDNLGSQLQSIYSANALMEEHGPSITEIQDVKDLLTSSQNSQELQIASVAATLASELSAGVGPTSSAKPDEPSSVVRMCELLEKIGSGSIYDKLLSPESILGLNGFVYCIRLASEFPNATDDPWPPSISTNADLYTKAVANDVGLIAWLVKIKGCIALASGQIPTLDDLVALAEDAVLALIASEVSIENFMASVSDYAQLGADYIDSVLPCIQLVDQHIPGFSDGLGISQARDILGRVGSDPAAILTDPTLRVEAFGKSGADEAFSKVASALAF